MNYQEYLDSIPDESAEPWVSESALAGKAIKGALPAEPEEPVLFIGAGSCGHACAVGALGFKTIAIELSRGQTELGNERVKANGLGLKVIPVWEEYGKLKFDDGTFPLVVAERGVLSLFEEPEKAFSELFRVCKPGGRIIATFFRNAPGGLKLLNGISGEELAGKFSLRFGKTGNEHADCFVFSVKN
ncbi:MAG: class I SAM-dependent methyltransferase [archaeon]